jgi:membrane protein
MATIDPPQGDPHPTRGGDHRPSAPSAARGAAARAATTLAAFGGYVVRRFIADGCFSGAGALSYTTLVSFVPLIAIVLAIFSGFPIFRADRELLLGLLAQYFIPEVGEEATYWFKYFASIAAQTTAVGVVALAVTAILMLVTIEEQLHAIWRVKVARPWLQRVLSYWALLTLGPLLIGMSLSLSGYFEWLAQHAGFDAAAIEQAAAPWFHRLALILPFLLETLACTLVYTLIPNCAVRWREGFVGGVVAAAAIELLKIGFAFYTTHVSSYRTVYGALAAIPIFLLWMYVAWSAVLLGAVVAAALPQWRIDAGEPRATPGGRHLGLALAILAELDMASASAERLGTVGLAERLGLAAAAAEDHLAPLEAAGLVTLAIGGFWVLTRPLDRTPLFELYRALKLPLAGGWRIGDAKAPWQRRVVIAMQRLAEAEAGAMRMPLAALLAESPPAPIDIGRHRA